MSNQIWYYGKDERRCGPVSVEELTELAVQQIVGPETLVWTRGMADWKQASELDELEDLFEDGPPPLPAPSQDAGDATEEPTARPAASGPGIGVLCPRCGAASKKLRGLFEEGTSEMDQTVAAAKAGPPQAPVYPRTARNYSRRCGLWYHHWSDQQRVGWNCHTSCSLRNCGRY